MARAIAGLVMASALAVPAAARGPHAHFPHHGHPINTWHGSGHIRLR